MLRPLLPPLVAALTLALAGAAQAHAFLDHADPKVGSVVKPAPRTLRLTFTEPVIPAFSRVTVTGPAGFGGAAPAQPAPRDRKTLVVTLNGAAPAGAYQVRWHVTAADTHVTEGDFGFRVAP